MTGPFGAGREKWDIKHIVSISKSDMGVFCVMNAYVCVCVDMHIINMCVYTCYISNFICIYVYIYSVCV